MSTNKKEQQLTDAIRTAMEESYRHPGKYFHVLVRNGRKPIVTDDGYKRAILVAEGWCVVANYRNGVRVIILSEAREVISGET